MALFRDTWIYSELKQSIVSETAYKNWKFLYQTNEKPVRYEQYE